MNKQSLYFLQALWDADVQKDKVLKLCKEASLLEIDRMLMGVLRSDCLWVSDVAATMRHKIDTIKQQIETAKTPYHMLKLVDEYAELIGRIQALQIESTKTITSESGPILHKMHMIVPQLFPLATKKLKEQTNIQLLRLLILNGSYTYKREDIPAENNLKEWVVFYKEQIYPQITCLNDSVLDGRWTYEKREFVLGEHLRVEQFVSITSRNDDLAITPGQSIVRVDDRGKLQISGRGRLTNIMPQDIDLWSGVRFMNSLSEVTDFGYIDSEYTEPNIILDHCFKGKRYLISPKQYFERMNQYLIIKSIQ